MKRLIVFLTIFYSLLFAYKYNEFLLKTQSVLFPKILLLDKKIDEKIVNGKIKFAIVFEKEDLNTALFLKSLISSQYNGKLGKYNFEIYMVPVDKYIHDYMNYTCVYFLKISPKNIEKIKKILENSKIYSLVYDKDYLKYGFLFSIDLEENPVIYMNKNAINQYFDFIPQLYQLVRLVGDV